MRFDFDEDQQAIRNDARRFLTERCAMDSVRDYLAGDQAEVSPLWHEMSELGWQGVAIPEAFGGLGMGYLELCVLAEELGRVAAPVPFASSIYLAAEAILRFGSKAQTVKYLPGLASGQLIGTVAWAEQVADASESVERVQIRDG
ncbi:MAG: acyl-CoA dehydrogenase family protein, partial [Halieaceae bacterium]